MIFKKYLLIGALIAPLFSHAADQERKPDAELSYPEQLAQYNKLKQPAQDFMDKILGMLVQSYGLMDQFSKQKEFNDNDVNRLETLNLKFSALREERKKLFPPPSPFMWFGGCYSLAGEAALAWDAQYHYFKKVIIDGVLPAPSDFIQVLSTYRLVADGVERCQQAIDVPPEDDDGDGIIVDKDTPVD
ncbi:hypothetical protein ACEV6Q_27120 [Enterobacter ludwigii]|uniref:hypothetical protein n=1 Tax=Enterobacter ludwigii TaxID=299767 RepID=UPI003BEED004